MILVVVKVEEVIVVRILVVISVFIMFIRGDFLKKGVLMLIMFYDSCVILVVLLVLGKRNVCGFVV